MKKSSFFNVKRARTALIFIAIPMFVGLVGCAGPKLVDSRVTAFSKLDTVPAQGASFRFERLPSQQAQTQPQSTASQIMPTDAAFQDRLEAWAAKELTMVGLTQQAFGSNPAPAAPWTVQVSSKMQRIWWGAELVAPGMTVYPAGYPTYYGSGFMQVHGGVGRPGYGMGMGYRWGYPYYPHYDRTSLEFEVGLVIRDAKDARVVYETKAVHVARWAEAEVVFPAMFKAALNGFPKPPEGTRRIVVDVTPATPPAPPAPVPPAVPAGKS